MVKKFLLISIVSIVGLKYFDCKMLLKISESVIKSAMEENGVVPDLVDISPSNKIEIQYPTGAEVNFGNELTPFAVKDEPYVQWPIEEGQFYTFVMVDPDAPSRAEPILGAFKHWLVMNIPGANLAKGETLAPFRGSAPPDGTGMHRYIFLVYKQTGYLKHSETPVDLTSNEPRIRFKVREIVKKYNLGQPVAGNFFIAQSDSYSKQLWAEWNKKT